MPKQEESKTVDYSKDQMFDLVADIDRYDEFLPWCNNSKIINTSIKDDIKIVIADLEIGYDQFVYTYRSEVKLHKDKSEIEIAYLGLLEEYQNKKLGSHLLSEAIKNSFLNKPKRVWVHTCSLDHKNALNNYIARGMKIFKSEVVKI